MRWQLGEEPWSSVEVRARDDLEQSVDDWMSRQTSKNWVPSALVLGFLLAAIVLLAVSRLA